MLHVLFTLCWVSCDRLASHPGEVGGGGGSGSPSHFMLQKLDLTGLDNTTWFVQSVDWTRYLTFLCYSVCICYVNHHLVSLLPVVILLNVYFCVQFVIFRNLSWGHREIIV